MGSPEDRPDRTVPEERGVDLARRAQPTIMEVDTCQGL